MKTYIYAPFILLVIMLTAVSCENEIPFNLKENPPKLVINALINADSLTNILYLNLTGKEHSTDIANATVEVRVNGQLRETLRPLPPATEGDTQCRFNITGTFSPGETVRIDAFTDDGEYHAWAEAIVPERPNEIGNIDTLLVPLKHYYYTVDYLRYKITLNDRHNENNFYRLIVEKRMTSTIFDNVGRPSTQTEKRYGFISREDVVLTDGHPVTEDEEDNGMFNTSANVYGVFDDARFSNNSYVMTIYSLATLEGFPTYTEDVKVDVIIRLLSITETEYYYLKALNLLDSGSYDETVNEPIKYPGNVNGGTGIIGFSTEVSKTVHINKAHL